MSKDFRKLIQESVKQKQLHPEDIPSLDLYMDQVIALMSEHLGEDGEKEQVSAGENGGHPRGQPCQMVAH